MRSFIRRFIWENFLRKDWYFVCFTDGFIRPAYWNGVMWEDRVQTHDDSHIASVRNRVPNQPPTLWTFERDGEVFDGEFKTKAEAESWAEDAFNEQCVQDGDTGSKEEDIFLIEFVWSVDGERRVELARIPSVVEYEYYHGDAVEHGIWHSGAGGVL